MHQPCLPGRPSPNCVASFLDRSLAHQMVAWTGVCLLILAAPFEALQPVVRLPGQSLSSLEIVMLVAFLAWLAAIAFLGQLPRWKTPLTVPWVAVMLTGLVAASAAPIDRANALRMVGRSGLAFVVFLMTVSGVTTTERLRSVLMTAAGVGVIISVLILLEYSGNPFVLRALHLFRPGIAVVGSQIRAAGPFQYPTIASMYLEIVFALTLGLLIVSADNRRAWAVVALVGVLALVAEGIALTFTRSGFLTLTVSLFIVGVLRYRRLGFDRGVRLVAFVALIVAVEILSSRSVDALRLRMMTETQDEWYRASVDAPLTVSLQTGALAAIPVEVTNTGLITWDPALDHPFRFSYHWMTADEDRVAVWEGARTEFGAPVTPGETVTLHAKVQAPTEPGRFRLVWDVEQRDRLWFSTEPGALVVETRAIVSGPMIAPIAPSRILTFPKARLRPGRMTLWRAAARMLRAHPLVGVGPDNFRLLYGQYAGIANADPRAHSNNMYLEVVAGSGLIGGLAFLWLGWQSAKRFAAAGLGNRVTLGAGVSAAGAAIAIHGLVDAFLAFTATYILIAVTVGLAVASSAIDEPHAYRV